MNWAKEMNDKGIKNVELTLKEVHQLYMDGKINYQQFQKILIDNLGYEKYLEIATKFIKETYE